MLNRKLTSVLFRVQQFRKLHTTSPNQFKIAVLGAAGGIGQPLSLLLKRSPHVRELALYDIQPVTPGVAVDLSHVSKRAHVISCSTVEEAIDSADVTVITAGRPRSPGMSRSDLFVENASILAPLVRQVALSAPLTMLCIITDPVNSLVPMAAELLKHYTHYDPRRLFGVTSIDSVRASTFVGQVKGLQGNKIYVPVVGGHCETTLIPVLSQSVPRINFPPAERRAITKKIQEAGTAVLEAKKGQGTATLSMAYAADQFVNSLMQGMRGAAGIIECAYVQSTDAPCSFFATPLVLGEEGISKHMQVGTLLESELDLLQNAVPEITASIQLGQRFAKSFIEKNNA